MRSSFRRQSLCIYIAAAIVFIAVAILPLGYMLADLVINAVKRPSLITGMIIDERQLILLARSLKIAFLAVTAAFVLGIPTAIILSSKDLPFKRIFFFLILMPVLIPSYVMAGAWIHLLSPNGFINGTLAKIFGVGFRISLNSEAGCAWCLGVCFFPIVAVIVAAGLSKIDGSLQDIARLSTNRLGVFWHSTIPQIWPHLAASFCLVFIFVLAQYGVPSLLRL